jgi:ABC-type transporter Mla subunit MlaD
LLKRIANVVDFDGYFCQSLALFVQVDTSSENINITVENLNHDLAKVSTWMSANQPTLNHSKTEYMIASR